MPATPTQMNLRRSPRRSTQTRTANALSKVPLGSLRKGDRRSLGTLNRPGAAPRLTPTKASVASPLGGKENNCQDGEEGGKPFAATEPSDDKRKRNLLASFMASEDSDDDSEDSLEHPPFDSSLSGNYRSDSSSDGSLASRADSGTVTKKGVDVSTQAHYPHVPTEIKIEAMERVDGGSVGLKDDGDALEVSFHDAIARGDGGAKSGDEEASVVLAVIKVDGALGVEFQAASGGGGDGGSKNDELEEDRVEGVPFIPAKVNVEGEDSSSLQEDDVIICPGLQDQLEAERKSLRQYQDLYADATSENSAKDAIIKQRTEERDTANDAVKGMKEQLAATDIQRNAYKAKNELLNAMIGKASARAEEAGKKLAENKSTLRFAKAVLKQSDADKEKLQAEVVAERKQGRAREEALTKLLAQSNADKKKLRADVDAVRAQRDEERSRARDSEKAWADKLAKSNAGLIKYQSENERLKLAVDAERNNRRVREKAWEVERERSNSELQRANAKLKTDRIEASNKESVMEAQLALAVLSILILVFVPSMMGRALVAVLALVVWFGI